MKRTDAPYTDAQLADLRQQALDFKTNHRLPWERFAMRVGTTAGVLCTWVNGKYEGDEQRIARFVDQYLADESTRAGRLPIGQYATLSNARLAAGVAAEIINQNSMGLIAGPPGCGKSMVMSALAANRAGVLAITIDQHSGSKAGLTRKLCEAVVAASQRTQTIPATSAPRRRRRRHWR